MSLNYMFFCPTYRIRGFVSLKTVNLIYFYWHLCWIRQGKEVWYEKARFALILFSVSRGGYKASANEKR